MVDKISIIVPVFNTELYLHRCIKSILNQTYSNLEVILIDDGSSDNSSSICDEYSILDNRIKVFHIDNSGVSKARNIGIKNSTGEWIGFVDSDDYIEPDMYETLINDAKKYSVDVAVCNYYIDADKRFCAKEYNKNKESFFLNYEDSILYLLKFDSGYTCGPTNKLYNKKIVQKLKFDENITNGEDLLFNFKIYNTHKIRTSFNIIPKYSYYIRYDSACHQKSFNYKQLGEIVIWKYIYYTAVRDELKNEIIKTARNNLINIIRINLSRLLHNDTYEYKELYNRLQYINKEFITYDNEISIKSKMNAIVLMQPYFIAVRMIKLKEIVKCILKNIL